METCEKIQELISRLLDEDLDREERFALNEHLQSCPECRAVYEAFSAVSASLKDDLAEPPESLRESVMAEIRREQIRKKNRRPWRAILSAAAVAALVLGLRFTTGGESLRAASQTAPLAASVQMALSGGSDETLDNGAVIDGACAPDEASGKMRLNENSTAAARAAEAPPVEAAMEESAVSDSAGAELYSTAAAAESTAAAADSGALTLDLSGTLDMAALLKTLDGEEVRLALDLVAEGPTYCLIASDGELELYRYGGELYYFDPASRAPMRTQIGEDVLRSGGIG